MDYCTLWLEGWWAHCCQAHDTGYVRQIGQAAADNQLFLCVIQSLPKGCIHRARHLSDIGITFAHQAGQEVYSVRTPVLPRW